MKLSYENEHGRLLKTQLSKYTRRLEDYEPARRSASNRQTGCNRFLSRLRAALLAHAIDTQIHLKNWIRENFPGEREAIERHKSLSARLLNGAKDLRLSPWGFWGIALQLNELYRVTDFHSAIDETLSGFPDRIQFHDMIFERRGALGARQQVTRVLCLTAEEHHKTQSWFDEIAEQKAGRREVGVAFQKKASSVAGLTHLLYESIPRNEIAGPGGLPCRILEDRHEAFEEAIRKGEEAIGDYEAREYLKRQQPMRGDPDYIRPEFR